MRACGTVLRWGATTARYTGVRVTDIRKVAVWIPISGELMAQIEQDREHERLTREIGPIIRPTWYDWYIATRGRRAVEDQRGMPGRVAWRRLRGLHG
jgi:hypothetical protein